MKVQLKDLELSKKVESNLKLILGTRVKGGRVKLVGKLFESRGENRDWCLKVLQECVWEAKQMEEIQFKED